MRSKPLPRLDTSIAARMKRYTVRDTENPHCIRWIGSIHPQGYGRMRIGRRSCQAHRVAYALAIEDQPLELDHLCRNKWCVNPVHLEPVIHQINAARGLAGVWGRSKTACPKGHLYDDANIYLYNGWRACRLCRSHRTTRRLRLARLARAKLRHSSRKPS